VIEKKRDVTFNLQDKLFGGVSAPRHLHNINVNGSY